MTMFNYRKFPYKQKQTHPPNRTKLFYSLVSSQTLSHPSKFLIPALCPPNTQHCPKGQFWSQFCCCLYGALWSARHTHTTLTLGQSVHYFVLYHAPVHNLFIESFLGRNQKGGGRIIFHWKAINQACSKKKLKLSFPFCLGSMSWLDRLITQLDHILIIEIILVLFVVVFLLVSNSLSKKKENFFLHFLQWKWNYLFCAERGEIGSISPGCCSME